MATNNFKPFAIGNNANVTSQSDYEALSALLSGFQAGKASSAQINKAIRQSSVIASVLAQFIVNNSGNDVLDDGNTTNVLNNLVKALNSLSASNSLQISKNLSDLASPSVACGNLGLKGAALREVGTTTGTVAAGDDSRITGALQKSNNFSDVPNISVARGNLGLKGASLLEVGTTANTVAAGNDSRLTGALQSQSNLSDLSSATTARNNLGLGSLATQNSFPVTSVNGKAGAVSLQGSDIVASISSDAAGNFWFKLGNFYIQSGPFAINSTAGGASTTVYFPISFQNACLSLSITPFNAASEQIGYSQLTKSTVLISKGQNDVIARSGTYFAIGY